MVCTFDSMVVWLARFDRGTAIADDESRSHYSMGLGGKTSLYFLEQSCSVVH